MTKELVLKFVFPNFALPWTDIFTLLMLTFFVSLLLHWLEKWERYVGLYHYFSETFTQIT